VKCRSCRAELGEPVLDLGLTPIANAFRRPDDPSPEHRYPLRVHVCPACFLVQLEDVVTRETHFHADYAYRSAASSSWRAHVEGYARSMIRELNLNTSHTVIEVGSNDGALARTFAAAGVRTIGIDPAAGAAESAQTQGVDTVVGFFGAALAHDLSCRGVAADLMCANNVLAHVPDLDDFVAGFAGLLKPEGLATFEFPLVLELLARGSYDTIYHEHYSYLSLTALEPLFARHGLVVADVERLSTHGGSARLHVRHAASAARGPRVEALAREEAVAGLADLTVYRAFAAKVAAHREALRTFVRALKADGQTIAAYGAPAKATTLLAYCGLGAESLDYAVDRAETKQGRLIPGTQILILPPERLWDETPDVVLILAWNLAGEIAQDLAELTARGARLATPMPTPALLP
jgi:SAM-dependent methyltransferase